MAIAFLILSLLSVFVFWVAKPSDIPVATVFIGLSLIYLSEIFARFMNSPEAAKLVGLWQAVTGIWLMYLTWATVVNFSLGMHWWL